MSQSKQSTEQRSSADEQEITRSPADEEPELVDIEHAPPRPAQAIAIVAALIGLALTAPFAVLAAPFGLAGVMIVGASLLSIHSRGWLTAGVGMILFGTLIAGAYGVLPAELLLIAVGATLLSWDVGQHGLAIGEQLGRQSVSDRNQLVHTAASAGVIAFFSAFAYAVFLISTGGRPGPAVVISVIGIILLAWTMRT